MTIRITPIYTDQINNFAHKTALEPNPTDSDTASAPQSPTNSDDYLSDYIQSHKVPLPALNSYDSNANDFDDLLSDQPNGNESVEGNWEENWLFQKRKHKTDTTVAPSIAMLVPSPTVEVKTLIGDKSADEISDLSEADENSDDDTANQSDGQTSSDIPHVLVESKTIIGGKNEVASFDEISLPIDDLLQPASLVSLPMADSEPLMMEAKNNLIFFNDQKISAAEQITVQDLCVNNSFNATEIENVAKEIVESVLEAIDQLADVVPQNDGVSVAERVDNQPDGLSQISTTSDPVLSSGESSEVTVVRMAIDDSTKEIPVPAPRYAEIFVLRFFLYRTFLFTLLFFTLI